MRTPQFHTDYAYYTRQLATQQAEQDAFDELFGFPKTDLAYAKAMERERNRLAPKRSWAEFREEFKQGLALRDYRRATGA